jgi:hypothetical protein
MNPRKVVAGYFLPLDGVLRPSASSRHPVTAHQAVSSDQRSPRTSVLGPDRYRFVT